VTGFLLSDGTLGCPPRETPPSTYTNPFRIDGAGALWVRKCFPDFTYLGSARHDSTVSGIIGDPQFPAVTAAKVSGYGTDFKSSGIPTGKYQNVTVTNDTNSVKRYMIGCDLIARLVTATTNQVAIVMSVKWNGLVVTHCRVSPPVGGDFGSRLIDTTISGSSNPHDLSYEGQTTEPLILQPGEQATVSTKLHIAYYYGAPTGTEKVLTFASAARVHGFYE